MTGSHRLWVLIVVLGLTLAGFVGFSGVPPAVAQQPVPASPNPQAGRASYQQNCAPCHGQTGRGDGPAAAGLGVPPTALADYEAIASKSLAEQFDVTKNGRMARMMPPWGGRLTDQEIWDTVAYAWTLHTSASELAAGKALYERECIACHGPDGKGQPPAPDLSDFAITAGISQQAWAAVVAQGRGSMPGYAGKLSAAEQRAVLEYVRSLSLGPMFREPLAAGSGVITGTVVNNTTGQPVADVAVELAIFDQSALLETRTAVTDDAGAYRFTDLPTDTDLVYVARVVYPAGGMPFAAEPASFAAGQNTLELPIAVYETTTDGAGVRADRVHYIVEFAAGRILVAEVIVFSLDGNRAYVGEGMGVLRFTLPAGAEDVAISEEETGNHFVPVQGGFVDMRPLLPGAGTRQILYRYSVPYEGSTLDLTRSIPYPITNLNALIADVGAQVSSDQLQAEGTRQTPSGNFISLTGRNLPANQPIGLRFTALPRAETSAATVSGGSVAHPAARDRALLLVLLGVGGLLVAVVVGWPLMRQRSVTAAAAAESADEIVAALAELDAAHAAGELGETAYRDQRLRLKARLLDLVRREGMA